jgi:hypothetical protein
LEQIIESKAEDKVVDADIIDEWIDSLFEELLLTIKTSPSNEKFEEEKASANLNFIFIQVFVLKRRYVRAFVHIFATQTSSRSPEMSHAYNWPFEGGMGIRLFFSTSSWKMYIGKSIGKLHT